jgi:hypothetical protein
VPVGNYRQSRRTTSTASPGSGRVWLCTNPAGEWRSGAVECLIRVARPESALGRGGRINRAGATPFAEPQGVPPKIKLTHFRNGSVLRSLRSPGAPQTSVWPESPPVGYNAKMKLQFQHLRLALAHGGRGACLGSPLCQIAASAPRSRQIPTNLESSYYRAASDARHRNRENVPR